MIASVLLSHNVMNGKGKGMWTGRFLFRFQRERLPPSSFKNSSPPFTILAHSLTNIKKIKLSIGQEFAKAKPAEKYFEKINLTCNQEVCFP